MTDEEFEAVERSYARIGFGGVLVGIVGVTLDALSDAYALFGHHLTREWRAACLGGTLLTLGGIYAFAWATYRGGQAFRRHLESRYPDRD